MRCFVDSGLRRRVAAGLATVRGVLAAALVLWGVQRSAAQPAGPEPRVTLSGQIDLARLLDLAAQRLDLSVEYDPAALAGAVTLRVDESLSDQQLWDLTNRVLAARGLTTVRLAGRESLSVVKLADARALSPVVSVEDPAQPLQEPSPGFVSVAVRTRHRPAKELAESLKPILSTISGAAAEIPGTDLLLVSDLSPRVKDALALIARLDTSDRAVRVELVPVRHLSAPGLVTLAAQVAAKRELVAGARLPGELVPAADGRSVLLVAPASSVRPWKDLIAQLDAAEPVATRRYAPRSFPAADVAELVEQTIAPGGGAAPAAEGFRLVVDELTGTLIVTATPLQHERIAELLEHLDSVPAAAQRPVRTFVVRNRPVGELAQVVQDLLGAGVLEAGSVELSAIDRPSGTQVYTPPAGTAEVSPAGERGPLDGRDVTRMSGAASTEATTGAARSSPLPAPGEGEPVLSLAVDEGTNTIIAAGEPRALEQLAKLLQALDVRQPQVMLEVLLVSLSDTQSLDLGVELERIEVNGSTLTRLSSLFGLSSRSGDSRSVGDAAGFTGVVLDPGEFSVVLRALETINRGRSLSMPKVLASNNQQATINSVLQIPFSVINASDTVATTSFGGLLPAGTIVTIRPQITRGDHLLLEYSVQLSSFTGASSGAGLPPPRQENQVQSVVSIPDGHTVVVGGLELITDDRGVSQVPLLGSIPILGEAFKSRSNQRSRTRFFAFIRAGVLRSESFEDLKHLSAQAVEEAEIDDGWPVLEPRIIE